MAHTHEFDCKQCGAHLDSREELDRHNREKHRDQDSSSSSQGFSSGSGNRPNDSITNS